MRERRTELNRDEMLAVSPDLVRAMDDLPEGPAVEIRYVLAWAVAPGGETVPGPGEPDADAVRAWAERAIAFQARGLATGKGPKLRRPPGKFVIPDAVVDAIHLLAQDEFERQPGPDLMARVAARIRSNDPIPEPKPTFPVPRPSFAPARA